MIRYIVIFFLFSISKFEVDLPVNTPDRKLISSIELTDIGDFGLLRKARPGVPAHYHTGIDIMRPTKNYQVEQIFPVCEGIVISKRDDGPYAQLIIEHEGSPKFWTVYEHIAGISVALFDKVSPHSPIARFMNNDELDKHGWQFDHFHFEVLKQEPIRLKYEESMPERCFSSYSLLCYNEEDLHNYFYDPLEFLATYF